MMNKKLVVKRIIFYVLSFTWGIIMTLIGLIAMIIPFGHYHIFHGRIYKTIGKEWGGVSFGCFFICAEDCQYDSLMGHECGHGIQNIILGPLMPLIVAIPSAIRYWYFEWYWNKYMDYPNDYDAIWFENQATRWGRKYILTDRI